MRFLLLLCALRATTQQQSNLLPPYALLRQSTDGGATFPRQALAQVASFGGSLDSAYPPTGLALRLAGEGTAFPLACSALALLALWALRRRAQATARQLLTRAKRKDRAAGGGAASIGATSPLWGGAAAPAAAAAAAARRGAGAAPPKALALQAAKGGGKAGRGAAAAGSLSKAAQGGVEGVTHSNPLIALRRSAPARQQK